MEALLSWCPLSFTCKLGGRHHLHCMARSRPRSRPPPPCPAEPCCFPGPAGQNREQAELPGGVSQSRGWHRCFVTSLVCPKMPSTSPSGTAPAVPRMLLQRLSPVLAGGSDTWCVTCQGRTLPPVWKWQCWAYRPGSVALALGSGTATCKRGVFTGQSSPGVALGVDAGLKPLH